MGHYLKIFSPTQQSCPPSGCPKPELSKTTELPDPVWVKLAVLPNPYSSDEALLLCRQSEDEWIAWVPDHGEVVLHVSEFYFDSAWN